MAGIHQISPGKPTIKDIARLAGVNHSTVSRALNGSPLISRETRRRIQALAEGLNFEFNEGARRLKNRTTGIVGVVYFSVLNDFRSSLYTNELFRDLRHNLEGLGLDALVVEAYNARTGASNIARLVRQGKVDGFVIIHPAVRREDYRLIAEHGLPAVHIHLVSDDIAGEPVDCFLSDDVEGGRIAARCLIESGCRRILTAQVGRRPSAEFERRTRGCREEVIQSNLEFDEHSILTVGRGYRGGYRLFEKHRELFERCDGVFIQTDIAAFGFLNALSRAGIAVPESMKVVGYDDSPVSVISMPPLTTIHQARERLTERACRRLYSLLYDDHPAPAVREFIKPRLVLRESC